MDEDKKEDEKIVYQPLKVDLHIHSSSSFGKDGNLVKDGTFENFGILKGKLQENAIDCFSITDHDCFDYGLYSSIKKFEVDGTFKKIFPGIEFSVDFKNVDSNEYEVVHVITIFNDNNDEKLKRLGSIMKVGNPDYDRSESFSEEKFRSKLQEIGLDAVLIAHQKNSLSSKNARKNDANSVGKIRFAEFVNVEYFESYEFKNPKVGMFNSLFKFENDKEKDLLRFVTGSDCHQWSFYPSHDENDKEAMTFTYLKCLPSFRGLAMALTDSSRIRTDTNFFTSSDKILKSIEIDVGGRHINAPLSPGINVIIGDNSIGKSMFLHAMTDYRSFDEAPNLVSGTKNKYKEFIADNGITVKTIIGKDLIAKFDSQGEIRKRFENGDAFTQKFIADLFPHETDSSPYRTFIDLQFNKLYVQLQTKFDYDSSKDSLPDVSLPKKVIHNKNVNVLTIPKNENESTTLVSKIQKDLKAIKGLIGSLKDEITDSNDGSTIDEMSGLLEPLIKKYDDQFYLISLRNTIRESANLGIKEFKQAQATLMTSDQSKWDAFEEEKETISSTIASLVAKPVSSVPFSFSFEPLKVEYRRNPLGDIAFVNRFVCNVNSFSSEYCNDKLRSVLLDKKEIDTSKITESGLTSIIKDKKSDSPLTGVNLLKEKITEKLDIDFKPEKAIVKNDGQDDASYSAGFNAAKYFSLLANDSTSKGIYIVDQPEDDVSQLSIKNGIVPDLRAMRSCRQIILVTHNPQFVVNLDADNVLYFFDHDEGFDIESGALEYQNENYDILKIVSDNLEGGIDSLKKRWKRYEKDINIV